MAQDKKITLDDVSRGIDKGLATIDQQRVSGLERLQTVRKAKATSLGKEQARLAAKYGSDHPRVLALTAKVELNRGLVSDLVIETTKAKTEIPIADQGTWVLHGFVRDLNRIGLPKLTIALFDGREHEANWIRDFGYACTDSSGYFKLTTRKVEVERRVFLRVLNNQGQTIYCDPDPLTARGGQVDYREIITSGEARECSPPPPPASVTALQWTVLGHVIDATGLALADLTVSLSDREQNFAARLGKTQTDLGSNFTFVFPADPFKDLIARNPDLFLTVSGGTLKQPFTHPAALHFGPGKTDRVTVTVPAPTDDLKPWTVRGQVSDGGSILFGGLTVSIADKAGKFTDRLGTRKTSEKGEFEFVFPAAPFADLIKQAVELSLSVLDANQKTLFITTGLHFEPGKTETVNVIVRSTPILPVKKAKNAGTAKSKPAKKKAATKRTQKRRPK